MSILLLSAAAISALTGVIHSVFGERLMFRQLRRESWLPTAAAPPLRGAHVRILWATWHLATVFCWAFAGLLVYLSSHAHNATLLQPILIATIIAHIGGAILVLVGTRGRHPGWIALGLVGVLCSLALAQSA
jgi:hypothetical protein